MNELLKVTTNEQQEPCISGRELHKFYKFLEVKIDYKKWFNKMKECGFVESVGFSVIVNFDDDDTVSGSYQEKLSTICM